MTILKLVSLLIFSLNAWGNSPLLDPNFGTNGIAEIELPTEAFYWSFLQDDGSLSIHLNGYNAKGLSRILENGTLDTQFGQQGFIVSQDTASDFDLFDLAGMPVREPGTNNFIFADATYKSPTYFTIARFTPDFKLDTTFGQEGGFTKTETLLQPEGLTILASRNGGYYVEFGQSNYAPAAVYRLDGNGILDKSFGTGGRFKITSVNGTLIWANNLVEDSSYRVLFTAMTKNNGSYQGHVGRILPEGKIDGSFNAQGNDPGLQNFKFEGVEIMNLTSLIQLNDGKLLVSGYLHFGFSTTEHGFLARLNEDGTLDESFTSGQYPGIKLANFGTLELPYSKLRLDVVDAQGRIWGKVERWLPNPEKKELAIVRFDANGDWDRTFNPTGTEPGLDVLPAIVTNDYQRLFLHKDGGVLAPLGKNENKIYSTYLKKYSLN